MRAILFALTLAIVPFPSAAAEPTCLAPRDDGDCTLLVDPDASDPIRYAVGERPPAEYCDAPDNDPDDYRCPEGNVIVALCLPMGAEPWVHARGGEGAPTFSTGVFVRYHCWGANDSGDVLIWSKGSREYVAQVWDDDGDGHGDHVNVLGVILP